MANKSILRTIMAIALGAIAGSLCRYYVILWIHHLWSSDFPHETLIVNLSGCFLMGIITGIFLSSHIPLHPLIRHPDTRLLITTGFLGSYTTFSSYELDSVRLLNQHRLDFDLMYWMGSAILGIISLEIGMFTVTKLFHRPRHPSQ